MHCSMFCMIGGMFDLYTCSTFLAVFSIGLTESWFSIWMYDLVKDRLANLLINWWMHSIITSITTAFVPHARPFFKIRHCVFWYPVNRCIVATCADLPCSQNAFCTDTRLGQTVQCQCNDDYIGNGIICIHVNGMFLWETIWNLSMKFYAWLIKAGCAEMAAVTLGRVYYQVSYNKQLIYFHAVNILCWHV